MFDVCTVGVRVCVLCCQPESRAVTGPECETDGLGGSWTRDGSGSTNWTVRALKLSKELYWALLSLKIHYCACVVMNACVCVRVFTFASSLMTLHSVRTDDKARTWFVLAVKKECLDWDFPFVAVNCFWQAVPRPHASSLTALALVSAMLHLLFISSFKRWLYWALSIRPSESSEKNFVFF